MNFELVAIRLTANSKQSIAQVVKKLGMVLKLTLDQFDLDQFENRKALDQFKNKTRSSLFRLKLS